MLLILFLRFIRLTPKSTIVMKNIPRRQFLITSGYLSIGFSLIGCRPEQSEEIVPGKALFAMDVAPGALPDAARVDAWLQLLEDGDVRILTGKMDLGQGLTIMMQQVAGEELNLSPSRIQVVLADTGLTQNEGYTSGSRSAERSAMIMRQAAATARHHLLQLAADHWKTSPEQLELRGGEVYRKGQTTGLTFSELIKGRQIAVDMPEDVPLKPKSDYQWVGRPLPHPDLERIVRGESVYIQDLRLPEMVHARVLRPAAYGAKFSGLIYQIVEDLPGVLKVVENGSFLAVITAEEYQAVKALDALRESSTWQRGPQLPTVNSWADYLAGSAALSSGTAGWHRAVYAKPYTMHASIGPSCAVAAYEDERLHIWSHTQGVYPLRSTISAMTGLSEDQIRITGMRGSGCYGHNGADDVAADAALLAMAFPGRPVRLQWQRSDEHCWEPYGSAMCMALSARLSAAGRIEAWNYDLWSDSHSTRPRGDAGNLLPARYLAQAFEFRQPTGMGGGTRNAEPYYDIGQIKVNDHYVAGPLRVSALRSLGAYANVFAIESFMDELADKAGVDPLEFRLQHLTDERARVVLEQLRQLVKSTSIHPGEGLGIAFSRYKNTAAYCAVAARVKVDLPNKTVKPLKMWAVLEAGEALNPDGLKNQTEGGMIQSVSWTLKEAVKFDREAVQSRDWGSYPILRYDAVPETQVVIIDRPDQLPMGAGEAAQGPAAAAIANAVYAACGMRVRELPIEKALFG